MSDAGGKARLVCGDALEVLPTLPEGCARLVVADPPYFKVKGEWWDRQWDKEAGFLEWVGRLCERLRRVLAPNGSLYLFASPRMAAKVEVEVGRWFRVLNRVTWKKEAGWSRKQCKEEMRAFWPASEAIIFAEQQGADNMAKGEAGYAAKCEELRGFVFEPLRLYLAGEFKRAGVKTERANAFCGTASMAAHHYFTRSQWCLPTREHYESLRRGLNAEGRRPAPPYHDFHAAPPERFDRGAPKDGAEYLRADYEDLRRDYEDLRRPFSVSADVPYTDVWDFPTVQHYPGKHPCEKPKALLAHVVRASSRPGDLVLDPFAGSGVLGEVCRDLGRDYLGVEMDAKHFAKARRRLADGAASLFAPA